MTLRVNGIPEQGVWVSQDVLFVTTTVTGAVFLNDLSKGNEATVIIADVEYKTGLQVVADVLQTRGTLIGLTVEDGTNAHWMLDYGQAVSQVDPDDIAAELEALINGQVVMDGAGTATVTLSAAAISFETGFGPVAPGVPA